MKRTIIWGAGQSGAMIQKLLKVDYQVIAYCDNKEALWGSRIDGLPVCAPREILDHDADCVVIAIMNFEAADAVSQQLQAQGFHGEVFFPVGMQKTKMRSSGLYRRPIPSGLPTVMSMSSPEVSVSGFGLPCFWLKARPL